jgi:hypothetical protein
MSNSLPTEVGEFFDDLVQEVVEGWESARRGALLDSCPTAKRYAEHLARAPLDAEVYVVSVRWLRTSQATLHLGVPSAGLSSNLIWAWAVLAQEIHAAQNAADLVEQRIMLREWVEVIRTHPQRHASSALGRPLERLANEVYMRHSVRAVERAYDVLVSPDSVRPVVGGGDIASRAYDAAEVQPLVTDLFGRLRNSRFPLRSWLALAAFVVVSACALRSNYAYSAVGLLLPSLCLFVYAHLAVERHESVSWFDAWMVTVVVGILSAPLVGPGDDLLPHFIGLGLILGAIAAIMVPPYAKWTVERDRRFLLEHLRLARMP